MAEKDFREVRLAEKSEPTPKEKVREQIKPVLVGKSA